MKSISLSLIIFLCSWYGYEPIHSWLYPQPPAPPIVDHKKQLMRRMMADSYDRQIAGLQKQLSRVHNDQYDAERRQKEIDLLSSKADQARSQ